MPIRNMFAVNQSITVYPRCGGVGMGDPERGWRGMQWWGWGHYPMTPRSNGEG